MSRGTLRVGVLGSSFGGMVHVPAFAAQGSFDVVAIASPSNAANVAKERGVPHAFGSLAAMLDGVELDVLSVASPPFDHRAAVLAGLGRGLHVLCEKPMATNVADAEEMRDAAARAGTVCAVAHEFRYTPARQAVRELAENGHLGALRAIESTVFGTRLRAGVERPNSWWFERRRGGGMTGAVLSHLIDAATRVAGRPPLRATGYERTAIPERSANGERFTSDVADGAFALVDYGDGLIATIVADATRAVESATLIAHGATSSAVASGTNLLEMRAFVVDAEETSELEVTPQPHANLAAAQPNLPAFVTMLDAFADAIAGKPADLPTFDDGVATQRVLEAIGYVAPAASGRG